MNLQEWWNSLSTQERQQIDRRAVTLDPDKDLGRADRGNYSISQLTTRPSGTSQTLARPAGG